jgi:AraC-like DNA-binding protein
MNGPTVGEPRGVIRRDRGVPPAAHVHRRYGPRAELEPFVAHFWSVHWDLAALGPRVAETLSHPTVHVAVERDASRVVGVVRRRWTRRLEGKGSVFGIKFRPGGFYPYFAQPVARLTDRIVPIAAALGEAWAALESAVLARADDDERVAAAEAFLLARLPPRDEAAEASGRLVERIFADPTLCRVEQLAALSGESPRALQRRFARHVGVGPKWVIQRYRLHEALARIERGEALDWAGLALDLGYFDQAHFIRDFRALVGCAPGEYARLQRERAAVEASWRAAEAAARR